MKGYIVINRFREPYECVLQANRLVEEFNNLGVDVEIIDDGYIRTCVENGKINSSLSNANFIVFLDKDKYLSEILERLNVPLFNSHDSVRVCDDKGQTILALLDSGINIPKTIFGALCYGNKEYPDTDIEKIGKTLGYPVIVKESFGSMGKGIYKADNFSELKSIINLVKNKPHIFQEFIESSFGTDIRVIVIGNKVKGAMKRQNNADFRSNVGAGGKGEKITISEEFVLQAEKISKVLNLDYCGIDLLIGKNNEPILCEVNSNAFFNEFERVTNINVANLYAKHIINKISEK